ncbi:MAG: hypothetical protein NTX08_07660 [Sphingobacteriales bacterium]|nr:hypothetical protein [Sphingobacteriales bacterium]
MKNFLSCFVLLMLLNRAGAQTMVSDTLQGGNIIVSKDARLDLLAKKEMEFNVLGAKSAKGYRLLVMNSNDREKVMAVRSKLLQQFPDQKVYMTFQAPNIKLKFGNFVDKAEAEKYRYLLGSQKVVTTNVYVVPEIVEVKPDKTKEQDDQ